MAYDRLYLTFAIDTNSINAKQSIPAMNLLETWRDRELLNIHMLETSHQEAKQGGSRLRTSKANSLIFARRFPPSEKEHEEMRAIEMAIFPSGARSTPERNDVDIVFQAKRYSYPLITLDGSSKRQPRGILGSREALGELGITVLTPDEAVDMARRKARELGVELGG